MWLGKIQMANKHINNCLIALTIMKIQIKAADLIAPSENGWCKEEMCGTWEVLVRWCVGM